MLIKRIGQCCLTGICYVGLALLAACSDGGDSNDAPLPTQIPAGRGELKSSVPLNTLSAAEISQALASEESRIQGFNPVYAVTSYRLEYMTTDAQGALIRASGLLSLPVKPAGAHSPLLSYQHPILFADAEAPSNHAVASEAAVALASLGFIVVAADSVGYGVSKGTPHPYLLAAPSAAATLDLLTAARTWRQNNNVTDNGQLFLAGYSEGGYVTMATHRAMQNENSPHLPTLRMQVSGAGPYDVQTTLDVLLDQVREDQPVLGALLNPGFLRYLDADIRASIKKLLLAVLLPDDSDVQFDTRVLDYFLADDQQALAQNSSVYNWKPELPVKLFHGREDETVPYANAQKTLQTMQDLGAGSQVSLTDCAATPSSHIGCVPGYLIYLVQQLGQVAQDL
jgi:dienelactone hydrolase